MEKTEEIIQIMKEEYLANSRPWIIGFSSGKDSTCLLQMAYEMLKRLDPSERNKTVHVLSTNTMVETPTISKRLKDICHAIQDAAIRDKLPIEVTLLKPAITETFWVNVIGRGYPCPNKWFRWCTDRLKIKPMNEFIYNNIKNNGEVVIVLGTRKAESSNRAKSMEKHEIKNSRLRTHGSIKGAFVFAPLENLDEHDVWDYLLTNVSGWGDDNQELLKLYKGEDAEAEIVLDLNAEPTGHSRFGCWTCTVVEKDKALQSLINEGHTEYIPLLEFRDELKMARDSEEWREKYRRNQRMDKFFDEYYGREKTTGITKDSLGPFTLEKRHYMLLKLLDIQNELRETVPDADLITQEEIDAIQLAWMYEGDDINSIQEIIEQKSSEGDGVDRLINRLLVVEKDMSDLSRRIGIYGKLEEVIKQYSIDTMMGARKK